MFSKQPKSALKHTPKLYCQNLVDWATCTTFKASKVIIFVHLLRCEIQPVFLDFKQTFFGFLLPFLYYIWVYLLHIICSVDRFHNSNINVLAIFWNFDIPGETTGLLHALIEGIIIFYAVDPICLEILLDIENIFDVLGFFVDQNLRTLVLIKVIRQNIFFWCCFNWFLDNDSFYNVI